MLITKGQVISGEFGKILIRQKSGQNLEIGELLISESKNDKIKIMMQVFELMYGSQISQQNLELISGLSLEESAETEFFDKNLRNYMLAKLKSLVTIKNEKALISKIMPDFFSEVREITKDDLSFLTKPSNALFLGDLRSGSKTLDVPIYLDGSKVLSHHILIAGTTGRGKSNLIANILWNLSSNNYCGMLVLDPHDEYYGRNKLGLKEHPSNKTEYYTPKNVPVGAKTLKINLHSIKPHHFDGVIDFSDAQKQALIIYYKYFGEEWIKSILLERKIDGINFFEQTISVVKRRLLYLLDLEINGENISSKGIFDFNMGDATISNISQELEQGKIVIIDTSSFSGAVEILVGSLITTEVFNKYRQYKMNGTLHDKPVISIILEEAPRVLGKEALEKGHNIFSTIAREGRKFKVGLTAITQLPSLIPRDILANINTKIILGIEMKPERVAIIESAAQDLSDDDRTIASLDIGEALISSNFSKFAIPVKISNFEETAKKDFDVKKEKTKSSFSGVKFV
ncbi:ATP-binding protein [Candidatus Woesearchaeota archaeon]|nr:ATP-binding protein [Candidatus Woesearchaeota archaeon]